MQSVVEGSSRNALCIPAKGKLLNFVFMTPQKVSLNYSGYSVVVRGADKHSEQVQQGVP
jgi:hypothetical protein